MSEQNLHDQGGFIVLNPIQIADEDMYNAVMDIIEADAHFRSAEAFGSLNAMAPRNFIMQPMHKSNDPIMVDADHLALAWCDADEPDNVDKMVAVILKLEERADGSFDKTPCGIIAGEEFQGVLQYRLPCCGSNDTGLSMLFFVMEENDKGEDEIVFATRDAYSTDADHRKLFEKTPHGVEINSGGIAHILDHHNNPGQSCGHSHENLPGPVARAHAHPRNG